MSARCSKLKIKIKKFFLRILPIFGWITTYTKEDAISDLIAGITISLTMIPQSIAYAALAGLSPQYGLNSAFMGCLLYVFFGTIKEVVIGPSSLMALLTYQFTYHLNVDFVILLCLLCGIVELIMGVLHLGFLISFFSTPVVSGFTSATSIIIIVAQLKSLFGLNFKSLGFVENVHQLINHIPQLRLGDTVLGFSCIVFLLFMRYLKDIQISDKTIQKKILKKIFWFLGTARNAAVVLACGLISMSYENKGLSTPFFTSKHVDGGLPEFRFPALSSQIGNKTYNAIDMVNELRLGSVVIPLIAVLANVAIAKSFAKGNVDATQEMLALAICNIFGSFFQSMPTCGAFTRSAVISASGVRTTFACLYSAIVTLLALAFLGPYFHYIPRTTLAAVLISAVVFLIDWEIVRPLFKTNRMDFITLITTFICCLWYSIEIGMLIGVMIGLSQLLYKWARPKVSAEIKKSQRGTYVVVTPQSDLYFASNDYISSFITKNSSSGEGTQMSILIDCSNITGSDYSAAKNINALSKLIDKRGGKFLLTRVSESVYKIWIAAGCEENLFCDYDFAEQALFANKSTNEYHSIEEVQDLIEKSN